MTERSWCPSLGSARDSALLSDGKATATRKQSAGFFHTGVAAKLDAAAAANTDAAACKVVDKLRFTLRRHYQRFDAAVVASNANRSAWPGSANTFTSQFSAPFLSDNATVCLDVRELSGAPIRAQQLAIPAEDISDLLSLISRRSQASSGNVARVQILGLVGLPSTTRVVPLSEVLASLMCTKPVLDEIHRITIVDASGDEEEQQLAALVAAAPKLEELSLLNCDLASKMASFTAALQNEDLKCLSLERSNIGCSTSDADKDLILSALGRCLTANKFLTSLNLSHTGLDAEAVSTLMLALAASNTRVLPQDIEDDKTLDALPLPPPLEDRMDTGNFVRRRQDDGADGEYGEDGGGADAEDEEGDDEDAEVSNASEDDIRGASQNAVEDDDDSNGSTPRSDDEEVAAAENDEENAEDEEGALSEAGARAAKKLEQHRLRWEKEREKRNRRDTQRFALSEQRTRYSLTTSYVDELHNIVATYGARIETCRAAEQQREKESYCARRSGWSHLETLVLRGNHVGDRGAKTIALVLRDEIPLSDEEAAQRQEALEVVRDIFTSDFAEARAGIATEEEQAWKVMHRTEESEAALLLVSQTANASSTEPSAATKMEDTEGEEEEDEYAKAAPPVVLTNTEDEAYNAERNAAGGENEGSATEAALQERNKWDRWLGTNLPPLPVSATKKGMQSIRHLDLGSCSIGGRGLKALAEVLRKNAVLETLCLRHNNIGCVPVKPGTAANASANVVSAEFVDFANMLAANGTLHHLDLSYCRLTADHVRVLAKAFRNNAALVTLGLEGNQLGLDEAYQQKSQPCSYLYELWMAVSQPGSAVRHLSMSYNAITACFGSEEAVALAAVCCQLTSLFLSHAGLQGVQVQSWSEALANGTGTYHPSLRVLHLDRNEFTDEACATALGSLLQQCTALEELSLDDSPLLGSAGIAVALEGLPDTMRRLSCANTGLTEPCVGAAQKPVIPAVALEQLSSLVLADVEVSTLSALYAWVAYLGETAKRLERLSLWARGMGGRESEVIPQFVELARRCASLRYIDCGFQPQFRSASPGSLCFSQLEHLLLPRR